MDVRKEDASASADAAGGERSAAAAEAAAAAPAPPRDVVARTGRDDAVVATLPGATAPGKAVRFFRPPKP
jgi:hypothetical protein